MGEWGLPPQLVGGCDYRLWEVCNLRVCFDSPTELRCSHIAAVKFCGLHMAVYEAASSLLPAAGCGRPAGWGAGRAQPSSSTYYSTVTSHGCCRLNYTRYGKSSGWSVPEIKIWATFSRDIVFLICSWWGCYGNRGSADCGGRRRGFCYRWRARGQWGWWPRHHIIHILKQSEDKGTVLCVLVHYRPLSLTTFTYSHTYAKALTSEIHQ